jgi:hypothetical protein
MSPWRHISEAQGCTRWTLIWSSVMPVTQRLTRLPIIPILTFYVPSGPPFRRMKLTLIFITVALRPTQYRFSLDVRAQPSYHVRSYTTADLEYFWLAQRGKIWIQHAITDRMVACENSSSGSNCIPHYMFRRPSPPGLLCCGKSSTKE